MSPQPVSLRQQVIDTCLEMNALGINQGTSGNVSVRHGDHILITPSGVPYRSLTESLIVQLDMDGNVQPVGSDTSGVKPSSEWRMHLDLYRSRPEVGGVVHTHSIYATALATLHQGIPPFHYMVAMAGGRDIRCSRYATFGTKELSDHMLVAMADRKACLLGNHGVIATGPNLPKALALADEVETLSHQYAIARTLGEPVLLSDEEMALNVTKFATYGLNAPGVH
jgi:L-fuculose-phosphate aldolase